MGANSQGALLGIELTGNGVRVCLASGQIKQSEISQNLMFIVD